MIWIFVECGERLTSIPLFLRGRRTRERWVREMAGRDGDGRCEMGAGRGEMGQGQRGRETQRDGRWTRQDGPCREMQGDEGDVEGV